MAPAVISERASTCHPLGQPSMLEDGDFPRAFGTHSMRSKILVLCVSMLGTTYAAFAVEQHAVVISNQHLYRKADLESKTVGRLALGEQVSVTGREGVFLQVTAPRGERGWTLAIGLVVLDNNPRAPGLLFHAAEAPGRGRFSPDLDRGRPLVPEGGIRCSRRSLCAGGPVARSRAVLAH